MSTFTGVPDLIRRLRQEAGLTQHELAVRRLSGAIRVGTGDVADDVRRARAQRGRERQRVR